MVTQLLPSGARLIREHRRSCAAVAPARSWQLVRIASSLRRDDELFQELLDAIELCLKLTESRELNMELVEDIGELLFDSGEDLGATERRPGWAACATLTPLATRAVCSLGAPSVCLSRHAADSIRGALESRSDPRLQLRDIDGQRAFHPRATRHCLKRIAERARHRTNGDLACPG